MAKKDNKLKGGWGETQAVKYLRGAKYRVINTNFRTTLGELDIIAVTPDNNILVFVEVKTRADNAYGAPCESIVWSKRRKINQAAAQYINRFDHHNVAVRFDVIEVYLDGSVNHIEHAFDSYLRY